MLKKIPVSVGVSVSASLLLLAAVLTFPGAFGFSRTEQIIDIENPAGFLLTAELPQGIKSQRKREFLFPDYPVLYEDGKVLGRPRASSKEITNAGRGRYQFSGSEIRFSTSDSGPVAGRVYTIRSPMWSLRESLLLAVWLAGLTAAAIAGRLVMPHGGADLLQSRGMAYATLGVAVALAAVFLYAVPSGFGFVPFVSDQFFLGLLFPAMWAALMGLSALQKHVAGRVGLLVLAFLPAIAGYFYYGVNAASDGTFLVGGIIPCSDARIHFLQAAEIALQGSTQYMFNGRFLYPASYTVLLKLAGLNVLVANLLVSCLVMLGLAMTCGLVAKRIGSGGTAIYCLLFWLYFRVHGCGLLMSENLGLLLGVLGFGFLLLSVDRNKIWPVFVALVFFGLGSAARPGALFILPALALFAGIRVWTREPIRLRMPAAVAAVVFGLVLVAGGFGANQLLMKSFCRGEGMAFGNFAFTLSGLLNGTKWSTSANATGWDTSLVMEQSIRQIKESPSSLIRGIGRAYGEALRKGFLFRFGDEKRFASSGTSLFVLAALGCWFWKPLRRDSGWILLLFAGILASVPFAPPWDAGERPYAVTVPVQIFLAAAGIVLILDLLRKLAMAVVSRGHVEPLAEARRSLQSPWEAATKQDMGRMPMLQFVASASSRWVASFRSSFQNGDGQAVSDAASVGATGFIVFAGLCLFLVVPAPFLLKLTDVSHTPHAFLPGSSRLVSREGTARAGYLARADYLDRLSNFQGSSPNEARIYTSEPGDFLLAINWCDLKMVVLPQAEPGNGLRKSP